MIVNGAPTNTAAYRLEGLDNTNHTVAFAMQENHAQRGRHSGNGDPDQQLRGGIRAGGGGLFNITMKSGTNQVSRHRFRILRE